MSRRISAPARSLAILAFGVGLAAFGARADDGVYKWTDENGVTHYGDSAPQGQKYEYRKAKAPAASAEEKAEDDGPPPKSESPLCKRVMANIETLEKSGEVKMDLDGDGTQDVLNEEQRKNQLDIARKQVAIYCE